jgi:IS5 family transposase
MDTLIPWKHLEKRVRNHYPKSGGRGRPPYPLSVMMRSHCVQLFYNLSDPVMEDMLYEIESVRRFTGLKLSGPIPDETTILKQRSLLSR